MTRWLMIAAAALLALPAGAQAAEPMILGVQTHFAYLFPKTTDSHTFRTWMSRARFNSSRDEMFWWHVEDASGGLEMRQGARVTLDVWRSMSSPFFPLRSSRS
jgi:hypothetical protein